MSKNLFETSRYFGDDPLKRKQLVPSTTNGYAKVSLSDGTRKGNFQIHRLVALAFIKNPKDLEIVNHIDGVKLNNDKSNLEWVDRKGNAQHAAKHIIPKLKAARKDKKDQDLKTRLDIVKHAHNACTANPELFFSIYKTVMCE